MATTNDKSDLPVVPAKVKNELKQSCQKQGKKAKRHYCSFRECEQGEACHMKLHHYHKKKKKAGKHKPGGAELRIIKKKKAQMRKCRDGESCTNFFCHHHIVKEDGALKAIRAMGQGALNYFDAYVIPPQGSEVKDEQGKEEKERPPSLTKVPDTTGPGSAEAPAPLDNPQEDSEAKYEQGDIASSNIPQEGSEVKHEQEASSASSTVPAHAGPGKGGATAPLPPPVKISSETVSEMMTKLKKPQFQSASAVTASASTTSNSGNIKKPADPQPIGAHPQPAPAVQKAQPQAPAPSPAVPPATPSPPGTMSPRRRAAMLKTRDVEIYFSYTKFQLQDKKWTDYFERAKFAILKKLTMNEVHATAVGKRAEDCGLNFTAESLHCKSVKNGFIGRLFTGQAVSTLEDKQVRATLLSGFYSHKRTGIVYSWLVDRVLEDRRLYDQSALKGDLTMNANLEAMVKFYVRDWREDLLKEGSLEPMGLDAAFMRNTIAYIINAKVIDALFIHMAKIAPTSGCPN